SHRMNRALKRANADVRLIIQDNADHWMSFEETRLETAAEMLKFLDEHIGE
ncbi:MAG: prolyl oligopeptidase family serine peptidase, partial [Robiginitomaculum sp.]|nr:prolyl oligopeptidase family serine peptidase [Robiginitomaculum sp.]